MKFAFVQENKVVLVQDFETEDEAARFAVSYQAVFNVTTVIPQPKSGWLLIGSKLLPPVDAGTVDYVLSMVYDPLVGEFEKIRRQFIAENIFWGINPQGKTRAVGDFMEPIEKWFNRTAPVETIVEIEKAKATLLANQELLTSLSPFVSIERLNWYKNSIIAAIAKTQ